MRVEVKSVPLWVTKRFDIEPGQILNVIRHDSYNNGLKKSDCYLVETKTDKAITLYGNEVRILIDEG